MQFIAFYSKQGPHVTPQNMLLERKCKIAVDYAAQEPDSFQSLLFKWKLYKDNNIFYLNSFPNVLMCT